MRRIGRMNRATMALMRAQKWRTATLRIQMIMIMTISTIRRSLAKPKTPKSISKSSKTKSHLKMEPKTATLMGAASLIRQVGAF